MMLKKTLKKLYFVPGATLNTGARRNMQAVARHMAGTKNPLLLNIGSGNRFLGGSSLARGDVRLVNLDIALFASVNVVGDAQQLPFADEVFDGIICQAVLEHVPRPQDVIREMHRVLQREGIIYIEVPFLQGYHPTPGDFFRFTIEGLEQLLADFSKLESGVCVGPASTVSWVAREFLSGILCGFSGNPAVRRITVFLAGWLTFPIKYLDLLLARRRNASHIASGIYFLGSKK
ncbi:MAG: methyltransferase domain-containing protein [Acidobacteriota bacterium]|nr:methyltransferase domain-containing protein [Acidobacteriota bacterium]